MCSRARRAYPGPLEDGTVDFEQLVRELLLVMSGRDAQSPVARATKGIDGSSSTAAPRWVAIHCPGKALPATSYPQLLRALAACYA